MALQFLYITAFTVLAVLAIANLVRNMIALGIDSQRPTSNRNANGFSAESIPHPEFLDEQGQIINEPLLVMRSMTVEDAREKLDALYEASPGSSNLNSDREEP